MADAHPAPPRVVAPPQEALAEVGNAILRSRPTPGADAPSETELSRELRISTAAAGRALDVLTSAGVLAHSPGHRRRALEATAHDGIDRLLRLVLLGREDVDGRSVLEVRTALERSAAAGAARSADSEDVALLENVVRRMRRPGVLPDEFCGLDAEFHLLIARASGNELQERLLRGLTDAMTHRMRKAFETIRDWPRTAHRLAAEHEHLVQVIARHRPDEAADLAATHVHNFYALRPDRDPPPERKAATS